MTRESLPNRRSHETFRFEFRGLNYTGGFGVYPDGRLAECFLDCVKQSSAAHDDARDIAVLLSIALQHGATPEAMRASLTRDVEGRPAGLAAKILDELAHLKTGEAA